MNVLVLCDSKNDCDKLAAQQIIEGIEKEDELTVELCYVNDLDSQKLGEYTSFICEVPQKKKSKTANVDAAQTNRKREAEEPMYLRRM